jgi:hypothetical protein
MRASQITRKRFVWLAAASGFLAIGMATTVVLASTPANGGSVGGKMTVVDSSVGEQIDPHVSGNLAAYTDLTTSS